MSTPLVHSNVILYNFKHLNEDCVKHLIHYYKNIYIEEMCGRAEETTRTTTFGLFEIVENVNTMVRDNINGQIVETPNGGLKRFLEKLNELKWMLYEETISEKNIDILRNNINELPYEFWRALSSNPSPLAIQLLCKNSNNIDWYNLAINPSPEAVEMLDKSLHPEANKAKIYAAKHKKHKYKYYISSNFCTNMYNEHMLNECINSKKTNRPQYYWANLSMYANADKMHLLRENFDKVNWEALSYNTYIYQLICSYDYAAIKRWVAGPFHDELVAKRPLQL